MSEINEKDVLEVSLKTLFGPVQELFNKLTGPAAEEYGLMWGDSVKMRRTQRLVKGLAKTKKILAEAGFDPQAVPDKLLLPIFEGMSVEDDEDLQEMWAALLANAASPESADEVRPGFIAILRQMSAGEAALFRLVKKATDDDVARLPLRASTRNELDRKIAEHEATFMTSVRIEFASDREEDSEKEAKFQASLQLLEHAGLIVFTGASISMTNLGHMFYNACESPKPKS